MAEGSAARREPPGLSSPGHAVLQPPLLGHTDTAQTQSVRLAGSHGFPGIGTTRHTRKRRRMVWGPPDRNSTQMELPVSCVILPGKFEVVYDVKNSAAKRKVKRVTLETQFLVCHVYRRPTILTCCWDPSSDRGAPFCVTVPTPGFCV